MPRCDVCGRDVDMPFRCSYCDSVHCEQHRLPESHLCPGRDQAEARARQRRRTGHPGVEVKGGGWTTTEPGATTGLGTGTSGLWRRLEGNVAKYMLYTIAGVYVAELLTLVGAGAGAFDTLFVLDAGFVSKPWTLVTSIFAHDPGSFTHILFNGIVLFFFGPLLERLIGSKRFLYLVLSGGVLAGVAQVLFAVFILGQQGDVLGLSGGLMALLGALTVLGPRIRVLLFFFMPAPLWAITVGYAALDTLGLLAQTGNIAHTAHLVGLALGLVVGYQLRQQGLAFRQQQGQMQGGMQRRGW